MFELLTLIPIKTKQEVCNIRSYFSTTYSFFVLTQNKNNLRELEKPQAQLYGRL